MTQEKKALAVVALCVVIIGAGMLYLRDREPPVVVTRARLSALQTSIEEWAAVQGRLPKNLEELNLPDEAIHDHADKLFDFRVSEDGKTVTLSSYGVDGKPGGSMFRADNEVTFTIEGSPAKN
ncbi:MAG: hypothetical protein KDN20_08720 [Verrucomicrobiae bacterium]|nr:hypothetical protein [Verrucomicrobiae bacterium]